MLFAHDGNVEKALKDSIMNSIEERKAKICDTWDPVKVMALPWGVKEDVEPQYTEDVEKFMAGIEGSSITLDSGQKAVILKSGIKERTGQYTLIFRYQLD